MRAVFAVAASAVLQSSCCDAFLNLPFIDQGNPALTGVLEAQESALLKIHLDIGQVEERGGAPVVAGSRLGINSVLVELRGGEDANYKHPSLPGADGPSPQLSTGPKTLEVLAEGEFVDLAGSHRVAMDNGVWEMIWRKDAHAGALICGFDVPKEVKRNDASLPKGNLYMTFPVWTRESLDELRGRRAAVEEKANEAKDRLDDAMRRLKEDPNPLMKAWHFRNACQAKEDIDNSGYRSYRVPPADGDVIDLWNGLHLCALGTVWTKSDFFGSKRILLGSAVAAPGDRIT